MTSHMEVMQLCRLCLEKEQVNVQIFEDSDIERQVHHKISTCLPVKVEKEDILPKKICDGCMYKLDILYEFWTTCANAETQLNEWLQESEFAVTEEEAEIDTKHEALCHGEEETLEEVAEIAQDALEEEVVSEPPPKRIKKIAENNEIGIELMTVAKTEVESDEEQAEETVYEEQPIDVPGPSGISQTDTKSSIILNKRRESTESLNSECAEMTGEDSEDFNIESAEDLEGEEEIRIKVVVESECDKYDDVMIVDDDFGRLDDGFADEGLDSKMNETIIVEEVVVKKFDPVHCDVCDTVYPNQAEFAVHSKKHSEDDRYKCHICDFATQVKVAIVKHIEEHEGSIRYKCAICKKALRTELQAVQHMKVHTGEKPYQCEICGENFMYTWLLSTYKRARHWEIVMGTPQVTYECKICNKTYMTKAGYRGHNKKKHGEKIVKDSLKLTLGKAKLTYEQLETVICEIEATINSRPLTYVSEDTTDFEILTPGNFVKPIPNSHIECVSGGKNELRSAWKQRQSLVARFWRRWQVEYLQQLRTAHQGSGKSSIIHTRDIVVVYEQGMSRQTETEVGTDVVPLGAANRQQCPPGGCRKSVNQTCGQNGRVSKNNRNEYIETLHTVSSAH